MNSRGLAVFTLAAFLLAPDPCHVPWAIEAPMAKPAPPPVKAPGIAASIAPKPAVPAFAASNRMEVHLNQLIYTPLDTITVAVTLESGPIREEDLQVYVIAPESRDYEALPLRETVKSRVYVTDRPLRIVARGGGTPKSGDGVLALAPNETFVSMFSPEPNNKQAKVVADFGLLEDKNIRRAKVELKSALAKPQERGIPAGRKKFDTLHYHGGGPVEIPVDEVVLYARDDQELDQFLRLTGGTVQEEWHPKSGPSPARRTCLIKVNTDRAQLERLPQMRALLGETAPLYGSSEAVLKTLALVSEYRLRGFAVSLNPGVIHFGRPSTREGENGAPWDPSMAGNVDAVGGQLDAMSPFHTRNAYPDADPMFGVRQAWAYLALFDKDSQRVPVAFIDNGFAPNPDFRGWDPGRPESMRQCDMETNVCGGSSATGVPTIGAGYFGPRVWHGTAVANVAGAVLNNGYGAAGTGGQVVVPSLYSLGPASYFEMFRAVDQATADGADVISMSIGLLCGIPTVAGESIDICGAGGIVPLCLHLQTVALAAAALVSWVPIYGAMVLGAAHAVFPACVAWEVSGRGPSGWRDPLQQAVNDALNQGVTIVAAAGNQWHVPPNLTAVINLAGGINLGENRSENWNIIPCTLPGVICVGGAEPIPPYRNGQWYGSAVHIWAPQGSTYYAPPTLDAFVAPEQQIPYSDGWTGILDVTFPPRHQGFWGTSSATPFISGVASMMIAVNPRLDRRNPALTPAERSGIANRIRGLLVKNASPPLQGDPRGPLVNAFRAVQAAAMGDTLIPDLGKATDAVLGLDESSMPVPQSCAETVRQIADLQARIARLLAQVTGLQQDIASYQVMLRQEFTEETAEMIRRTRLKIGTLTSQIRLLETEISRIQAQAPCCAPPGADRQECAVEITASTGQTSQGTILTIPASPPNGRTFNDEDWYAWEISQSPGTYKSGKILLEYYRGFGQILINGQPGTPATPVRPPDGVGVTLHPGPDVLEAREFPVARSGLKTLFRVTAVEKAGDNVYWLSFRPD